MERQTKTKADKSKQKEIFQTTIAKKTKGLSMKTNKAQEKQKSVDIRTSFYTTLILADLVISLYLSFRGSDDILVSLFFFGFALLFVGLGLYICFGLIVSFVGFITGIDIIFTYPSKPSVNNAYTENKAPNINVTINKESSSGGFLTGIAAGVVAASLINKSKNKKMHYLETMDREDHADYYGDNLGANLSHREIEDDLLDAYDEEDEHNY